MIIGWVALVSSAELINYVRMWSCLVLPHYHYIFKPTQNSFFLLTWWKPRYVSIEWVAKNSSPLQSKIIRKPFNAWNEKNIWGAVKMKIICLLRQPEITSQQDNIKLFQKLKIIWPAKTFLRSTADCRKWQSPFYNDCLEVLLLSAEILQNN